MAVPTPHAKQLSFSPEQTEAVLAELDAILASASFAGSKRCHEFLDFIVRRTLAGDSEQLTERFIGADLFGRAVDYETATDAIVRVRANDLRRRLAQYYSERSSTSAVTISLPSGSYIPEFQWPAEEKPAESQTIAPPPLSVSSGETAAAPTGSIVQTWARRLVRPVPVAIALVVMAGILILITTLIHRPSPSNHALEQFWQPVLDNKKMVTFCFGDTRSYYVSAPLEKAFEKEPQATALQGEVREIRNDSASAGNIRALLSIMGVLTSHGAQTQLRWPQEVQRAELDHANVVYVGAFSNSWTMSLNQNLRFAFERDDTPEGFIWMIRDRNQPGRQWSLTQTYPQPVDHDYAVITRLIDTEQKRVVISVGGLNLFGTQAAGEFLADGAALNSFAQIAPKGWEKRNLQIVLEMGVSQNRTIDPKIVAINVW